MPQAIAWAAPLRTAYGHLLKAATAIEPDDAEFAGYLRNRARDLLTNAVKRVALLSNERSRAVKFVVDQGKVDVTSSSPELGEAQETLMVDYSGPAMQTCFNAQYVLDFLAVVTTDDVALELKDEVSQAVMMPVGAEGYEYTYVIMPMRV